MPRTFYVASRRPLDQLLLRIRNSHPAFSGRFRLAPAPTGSLALEWTNGAAFARLDVDLTAISATLICSAADGGVPGTPAWRTGEEPCQ